MLATWACSGEVVHRPGPVGCWSLRRDRGVRCLVGCVLVGGRRAPRPCPHAHTAEVIVDRRRLLVGEQWPTRPVGPLRVVAPVGLGRMQVVGRLGAFSGPRDCRPLLRIEFGLGLSVGGEEGDGANAHEPLGFKRKGRLCFAALVRKEVGAVRRVSLVARSCCWLRVSGFGLAHIVPLLFGSGARRRFVVEGEVEALDWLCGCVLRRGHV